MHDITDVVLIAALSEAGNKLLFSKIFSARFVFTFLYLFLSNPSLFFNALIGAELGRGGKGAGF